MKYCKDCVHYKRDKSSKFRPICTRSFFIDFKDKVTGERYTLPRQCWIERNASWFQSLISNKCGDWGIFYKEKKNEIPR